MIQGLAWLFDPVATNQTRKKKCNKQFLFQHLKRRQSRGEANEGRLAHRLRKYVAIESSLALVAQDSSNFLRPNQTSKLAENEVFTFTLADPPSNHFLLY
jgi:hypothetical protein